jgi:hypothetical protein
MSQDPAQVVELPEGRGASTTAAHMGADGTFERWSRLAVEEG